MPKPMSPPHGPQPSSTLLVAWLSIAGALLGAGLLAFRCAPFAFAQEAEVPAEPAPAIAPAELGQRELSLEEQKAQNAIRFAGGAPLKTNPYQDQAMRLADAYAADKHYDFACELWQKVINESGDALISQDGEVYVSIAEQVERTVAGLPPEALRTYRVSADGEALALLAADPTDRERALSEVVRRYFLSSHGDEAAYELGCLALDRYDFVGALRLFERVLHRHPDPTVPQGELQLRLALASGRLGDAESAEKALAEAASAGSGRPSREALAAVRQDVKTAPNPPVMAGAKAWRMPLGSASGVGAMAAVPDSFMASPLTELWGFRFPIHSTAPVMGEVYRGGYGAGSTQSLGKAAPAVRRRRHQSEPEYYVRVVGGRDYIQEVRSNPQTTSTHESLVQRWKANRWRPVDHLLLSDGGVFFKTHNNLLRFSAAGDMREEQSRCPWRNLYDEESAAAPLEESNYGNGWRRPLAPAEVMYFGDQVRASMSILDGVLYSVEGRKWLYSTDDPSPPEDGEEAGKRPRPFGRPSLAERPRTNQLAAYVLATDGSFKWRRSAGDPDAGDRRVGFLAAPTPYGKLLLVPVVDEGSLWLYALSQTDGKTVWKSFLCDQPAEGWWPWNRVAVAVEGRDAYVAAGGGVVFSVDAASGSVRMAVRYPRDFRAGVKSDSPNGFLHLDGCDEDILIAYGRGLIVVASDRDAVFCLDRNSGETLWHTPRSVAHDYPVDYCLGLHQGVLYLGGRNTVRAIDAVHGVELWEQNFQDTYGRGALTENGVYLPQESAIVKLHLTTGAVEGSVPVELSDDEPVGNLFSDGEKLWGVGADRVYALTSLEHRLALVEASVKAGAPHALLERMRLYLEAGKSEAAFADLLAAFQSLLRSSGRDVALKTVLKELSIGSLPAGHPVATLAFLQAAVLDAETATPHTDLSADTRVEILTAMTSAMHALRRQGEPGGAPNLAALLPLLTKPHELSLASRAMVAAATPEDAPLLLQLLQNERVAAVMIEPYGKAAGAEARPLLRKLLQADDEEKQLAAARSLANMGDRDALEPLVQLLASTESSRRVRAQAALQNFTGQKIEFDPFGEAEARADSLAAWRDWVVGPGTEAELHFPLPLVEPLLGRTLVALYGSNLVLEFDAEGNKRWERQLQNPWACEGLPNGHRLIACFAQNLVVEYDEQGDEVWRKEGLPGNPFSVQRLTNGNTLVACSNAELIVEIRRDGTIAWQAQIAGRPMDAHRLDDGTTLVALANAGKVVQLNARGETIRQIADLAGPISVQPLDNGRLLVAQMNSLQVIETDWAGNVAWTREMPSQPYCAQKTPSGTVLMCGDSGAFEIAPDGKTLWNLGRNNVSGLFRY
ncbi:outer membrane protein assembly factor BamB family protein [Lignipirellula cremea]|uniref:Outer membrane protein assembly factor BamB n=1 Tax=Lignipirellula cremea TaxID=2528010 RepID=A0A518DXA9_9BACT|nr:PQQ-binding-like beta-propeller repeat protein [Lignipirellula cremea]QDU96454.1 Outer membrane protein assembly factor BamB [Lignipirellula cremea]